MHYNNEFPYNKIPPFLYVTKVQPLIEGVDVSKEAEIIDMRFAAATARELNTLSRTVASLGSDLISQTPLGKIDVKVSFHVGGLYLKDVWVKVVEEQEVSLNDGSTDHFKNFLNKQMANLQRSQKYKSDSDFFWLPENEQDIGSGFAVRDGFTFRTVIDVPKMAAYMLVDTAANNVSKGTLMDAIKKKVEEKGLASWRDLKPSDLGYFSGQGVRSTYETMNGDGEMEHKHYRITRVDLTRSVAEALLEDGITTVLDYNTRHGYTIEDPDQPVIVAMSFNRTLLVPSHLSRTPGPRELKAVSSALSTQAARIAKKDPASKAYLILDFIKVALQKGILSLPVPINVEYWHPQITMDSVSIDIKSESDFRAFFNKGKVQTPASWEKMLLCHDETDATIAQKVSDAISVVLKKFKMPVGINLASFTSTLRKGGKPYLRDYEQFIMDRAASITTETMLSWISPVHYDVWYATLKRDLVIRKEVPTQQLLATSISKAKSIEWDYVNPLFMQMIAKMGGFPYLFPKAMTFADTVFIGIDRFVDTTGDAPSVTAATACFSNQGEYLGAGTADLDAKRGDDFSSAASAISDIISDLKARNVPFSRVIILRDGTRYGLDEEVALFKTVLVEAKVKGMIVTANKSYPIRFFKGESFDFVDEDIEQYLSLMEYHKPTSFIIQSTAVTAGGMSRPILYNIEWQDFDEDLPTVKASLARAIIAFTRMNWGSIRGNQLPAPLKFAHILAQFCGTVKSPWPRQITRPLFL